MRAVGPGPSVAFEPARGSGRRRRSLGKGGLGSAGKTPTRVGPVPWQCWVGFPCMGGSEKAEARLPADLAASRQGVQVSSRGLFPCLQPLCSKCPLWL